MDARKFLPQIDEPGNQIQTNLVGITINMLSKERDCLKRGRTNFLKFHNPSVIIIIGLSLKVIKYVTNLSMLRHYDDQLYLRVYSILVRRIRKFIEEMYRKWQFYKSYLHYRGRLSSLND